MKKLLTLIAMTVAIIGTSSYADARPRHYIPSKKFISDVINVNVASTETVTLSAVRHRNARRYAGRRCDGIHGCVCGTTQARALGLPLNYNGFNLKLAKDWARALPHTSAQPGAVVVQDRGGSKGHVSRIVQMTGQCRAIVSDEKGQYERDICRRLVAYVSPTGGMGGMNYNTQQYNNTHQYSARKQRHPNIQVAANYTYGYDPSAVR